jgi:RNA polymerase sigma-70 factor (ECF subfamily)
MSRYQDGDTAAFEMVYERHRGPLYRYFLRQTARTAVDDLFQEVWLRVIKGKDRYQPDAPFSAYLYRIAHNVLVDHYRRSGRAPELTSADELELPAADTGPARDLAQSELRDAISAALEDLPAAQREAFLLHQEAGLTLEQIAMVVGVGRETIKSRLRYAMNRLRQELSELASAEVRQA